MSSPSRNRLYDEEWENKYVHWCRLLDGPFAGRAVEIPISSNIIVLPHYALKEPPKILSESEAAAQEFTATYIKVHYRRSPVNRTDFHYEG